MATVARVDEEWVESAEVECELTGEPSLLSARSAVGPSVTYTIGGLGEKRMEA